MPPQQRPCWTSSSYFLDTDDVKIAISVGFSSGLRCCRSEALTWLFSITVGRSFGHVHDVANLRPKISHNPLMQCQWRQAPPTPDLPFCHKISIEFTFSWFSRTVSHHLFACLRSLHGGQRLDLTVTAPATALDLAPTQLLYLWSVSPMLDDLRTIAMVIAVKLLLRSGKPTMIEKTNIVTILIRTSLAINSRQ